MATLRRITVFLSILVAGAMVFWGLRPTSPTPLADTNDANSPTQRQPVQNGSVELTALTDNVTEFAEKFPRNNDGLSLDQNRVDANVEQFESFEAHMAQPDSYLVVDNALRVDRLEQMQEPGQFDELTAELEQNANNQLHEKAVEYTQIFSSLASETTNTVSVSSVVCGQAICTAKILSQDTDEVDGFIQNIMFSEATGMYATAEMNSEASGGYDIRRIVFTTNPDDNAFEMPLE